MKTVKSFDLDRPEYENFKFETVYRDPKSRARLGRLTTPHGTIDTPNFIFCGTKAAMKAVTPHQMREAGADIILSNTYHLMIQPGADLVEKMGGLHEFMRWDGPMLTDSGGFQIFSMGGGVVADEIKGRRGNPDGEAKRAVSLMKITEEGAHFRAYTDGRKLFLSPEESIDIQRKLGPDLIVQLDECSPAHMDREYMAKSMEMSARWGDRSLAEFIRGDNGRQALYGIVQGGTYPDLRKMSGDWTQDRPFFGTAIGGSLGRSKEEFYEVVDYTVPHIHPDRPVHLLGIGGIVDIFKTVRMGMDTYDCVSPTRIARHGWALKKGAPKERLNLRNARFREEKGPIDEDCSCYTCQNYSAAYIHHLQKAGEFLALELISIHNVATMTRLFREIREAIRNGTLDELEKEWIVDSTVSAPKSKPRTMTP